MSVFTIKRYLEMAKTPYTRSEETVYQFYGRMPEGSRISGCEVFLRSVNADVFVTVELPVNVMPRESYGVAKYLARVNQERSEEGKLGYFMLDYVKHKIIYALPGSALMDAEVLESAIEYAVRQVDFEIEEIIRVVCEEGDKIFKEDEERRRQQEMEEREPGPFRQMANRLLHKIAGKIGLIDDDDPDDIPEYADPDEDERDFDAGFNREPDSAEPADEQREQEAEEETDPEEESESRREPEFEEILKILGIDTDKERPDAADEPAEESEPDEEQPAGEAKAAEAPAEAAEEADAPAEEPKKEEQKAKEEE